MQQGKIHVSGITDTSPFPSLQAVKPNSKLPVVLMSSFPLAGSFQFYFPCFPPFSPLSLSSLPVTSREWPHPAGSCWC